MDREYDKVAHIPPADYSVPVIIDLKFEFPSLKTCDGRLSRELDTFVGPFCILVDSMWSGQALASIRNVIRA